MSVKQMLKSILFGPTPKIGHLSVRFYMKGGQVVQTSGVATVKTTKTNEGGFASYEIVWHDGYKPKMFSLALDHISAIVAEEEWE